MHCLLQANLVFHHFRQRYEHVDMYEYIRVQLLRNHHYHLGPQMEDSLLQMTALEKSVSYQRSQQMRFVIYFQPIL